MSSPILWGPSNIASNLEGAIINSDNSINKYDGVQNYILNSHAELNTTGWATYADAAQATPVNGTGGSPTVTWTQTTTAPLDGSGSFVFTKDAANRQGEGASYDFTIDSASQTKVLNITFDYIIGSGTFVAGSSSANSDIVVYIYDVTNSVLIQPTTFKLYSNSSTIPTSFQGNFQTAYNSTSYRLIFHCATTSASAYTVKFDNVKVSPSQYVYGTPITDWQSYTLTIGAVTTPPTQGAGATKSAYYRRTGDSMEIMFTYAQTAAGSGGTGKYLYPIPSGYTIDTNKITVSTSNIGAGGTILGNGQVSTTTAETTNSVAPLEVVAYNSTNLLLNAFLGGGAPQAAAVGSNAYGLGTTPLYQSFTARVPITGWSSCVQMSDQTTQQVVDFSGTKTSTQAITANVTNITFTAVKDSTGSWNGSQFTVPVAGDYMVNGSFADNGATSQNIYVYLNGSISRTFGYINAGTACSGAAMIPNLVAGDIISLRSSATTTIAGYTGQNLSIFRISGPSSIAATDTVAASYWLSGNFTASTTVPINFDSREYDYTGSVQTSATAWRFVAPISGLYQINFYADCGAVAANIYIYKNGSNYKQIAFDSGSNAVASGATGIRLLAGEYIDFRPSSSITINGGTLSGIGSAVSIIKAGNY